MRLGFIPEDSREIFESALHVGKDIDLVTVSMKYAINFSFTELASLKLCKDRDSKSLRQN